MSSKKMKTRGKPDADKPDADIADNAEKANDAVQADKDILVAMENIIDKKLSENADRYDQILKINAQLIEQNRLLQQRVAALEEKLNSQVTVADLVAECIETAAELTPTPAEKPAPTAPPPDTRTHIETLMMRHVNVNEKCVKEIMPGARCEELYLKFLELNEVNRYSNIIVVGTNYIRDKDWTDDDIFWDNRNFLYALNNIMPESTTIHFCQILPKRARYTRKLHLPRINSLNSQLDEFGMAQQKRIMLINWVEYGNIFITDDVFSIISRDGTHLNRHGVMMVGHYLNEHLSYCGLYGLWNF